jgi:hypothetical protein
MSHTVIINLKEIGTAKEEQRGNREAKNPKKKIKTIAAAPSQKTRRVAAELRFRQEEIVTP